MWKFNRKRAVKVVLEQERSSFSFEREVNAALLAVYALWPSDRSRLRSAARNLARLVTFGEISEAGGLETRLLSDLNLIRARLAEPWYVDFHEQFVKPLGGLPTVLEARGSRSLERQIQEELNNSSTRIRCDLVRFLVCMSQHNHKFATRGKAIRYVSENIFGVADHYGVTIRGARKRIYQQNDPVEHAAIGKKKVEKEWDNSPRTAVLLYAIENTLPVPRSGLKHHDAVLSLQAFLSHPQAMAAALCLYEGIMEHLEALPPINAVRKWRVFKVESSLDGVKIPTFKAEDIRRLRRIGTRSTVGHSI